MLCNYFSLYFKILLQLVYLGPNSLLIIPKQIHFVQLLILVVWLMWLCSCVVVPSDHPYFSKWFACALHAVAVFSWAVLTYLNYAIITSHSGNNKACRPGNSMSDNNELSIHGKVTTNHWTKSLFLCFTELPYSVKIWWAFHLALSANLIWWFILSTKITT